MKRSWIFRVSTVGFVSGLLFWTVAQGQDEPKAQSGNVARGKTIEAEKFKSVVLPRLATGVGGLDGKDAKPMTRRDYCI
jgi:O-acetyl-ADP-ribose deacetylase (regulator of RNase III)